ncbi:MAG: SIR2 family protein [Porphyromonas sp.]|nr:SIR2 family protein [Porphyromonas sp.]
MAEIHPGLKAAIEADDLVLFIGAGLSWNFKNTANETLDGWEKMVSSILSHLKDKGYITDELKQSCKGLEPIDALEILENNGISRKEVGEFLKSYFTLGRENDFSLQEKLFKLSTKIITTNYDRAFEEAVPELQNKKAYKTKDYELNRLKKDPTFLFKLHGCIEHMDSMVLFPSDYKKLYNSKGREAEHALYALRNLIFNKTFLFIGTGLGDPQINGIFKEIKRTQGVYSQEHYIIISEPLKKSLSFLTPIQIASHAEIPAIVDQLSNFKQAVEEKKSPEEKILLAQLEEAIKEREVLTKEIEKEKDKNKRQSLLLEREANHRFSLGLMYTLAGKDLAALKEYEAAVDLKPDDYETLNNLGLILVRLAKTKSAEEAEQLYKEAFKRYETAIQYNPNRDGAYYDWGTALRDLAGIVSGDKACELLDEAIDKFNQGIERDGNSYNLARLYAIRNRKEEALKYLDRSLSRSEISVEFVGKDKDWNGLRDDPDFNSLLSRYKRG